MASCRGKPPQAGRSSTGFRSPRRSILPRACPYYLLIVGSPERMPFEFQALLKMQWAVGRLTSTISRTMGGMPKPWLQYENENFKPVQAKNAAVWVTRNSGDLATAMLSGAISQDFLAPANQLGARSKFMLSAFVNDKATKPQLIGSCEEMCPKDPRRSSSSAPMVANTNPMIR